MPQQKDPYIGMQFGEFRLIEFLGEGGFAKVYKGQHINLGPDLFAAVKLLMSNDHQKIAEFRREAARLARLRHPNIVYIHGFGVPGASLPPFLAMEFAPNGTMERFTKSPQPLSAIIKSIRQAAEALQYIHDQGLLHLDIKPENILFGRNDEVLLSDFGIARDVQSAQPPELVGSIEYMAPERLRRQPCPASDQYALAVVVYKLLTGICPFPYLGGPTVGVAQRHLKEPPPPLRSIEPSITAEIEQIVLRALEKDPQRRYPDTLAFAQALEDALGSASAPPTSAHASQNAFPPTTPVGPARSPHAQQPAPAPSPQPGAPVPPTIRLPGSFNSYGRQLSPATLLVLPEHRSEVTSLSWSPDGTYLASASTDRTVRIWEAARGDCVLTFSRHRRSVRVVAWSPDGAHMASLSRDQVVYVWKPLNGQAVLSVGDSSASSYYAALAWSPDSRFLASTSDSNKIHIWEALSGNPVGAYNSGRSVSALSLAWSPSGDRIAGGYEDGELHTWELSGGSHTLVFSAGTPGTASLSSLPLAWSPDGKLLAAAYPGQVYIWDAADTDRLAATIDGQRRVSALAWSPDSKLLAVATDVQTVEIWEVATQQRIFSYVDHAAAISALAWSPAGRCLASADEDKLIYLWQIK